MTSIKKKPRDLREACVQEALEIIGKSGVEGLSLRAVSRRLGVSHQAPYKHYPTRDHLLAEIVARAYTSFAQHLDSRPRRKNPFDDLQEIGRAYMNYALANPLHYRLMFNTALPDAELHPEMMERARHAFSILRDAISRLDMADPDTPRPVDLDALYVWATVHGLASIMPSSAMKSLPLSKAHLNAIETFAMGRLRSALQSAPPKKQ